MPNRNKSTDADFEPALNVTLAELLKKEGVNVVRREKRQPGSTKRFDIEVRVGELTIAVEAETDNQSGALRDAQRRLDQHEDRLAVAHEAVAVNYPSTLRIEDFDALAEFEWSVLPSDQFTAGRVSGLASALRQIPEQRGNPEAVAKALDDALTQATTEMSNPQIKDLAAELNLPILSSKRGKTKDLARTAAKRGLLVIAAAAMFHSRLDDQLQNMRPEEDAKTRQPYQGEWPPMKLHVCLAQDDPVAALRDAWEMILAVDYRPVFESANRALMAPTRNEGWILAVKRVATAAQIAAGKPSSHSHDLIGRIFHRLLDSARYDGSFYTSTSAALLLAGLAIPDGGLPEDLSSYRVIDPACGTGTLLMAAAERIKELRSVRTRQADAETLIEDVIWGLDVNVTACHMAATTLGLMSPSTAFKNMNIHMMKLGATAVTKTSSSGAARKMDVRVGSLELLETSNKSDNGQKRLAIGWSAGRQVDTAIEVEADPNAYHLVIMNPPYTRDSLRHDQFTPNEEKLLKKREKQLTQGRAGHGSSAGTMFIDLGEHLTELSSGATLAVVFPLSGAGAPSTSEVRKLLAEQFHIEWVVASHDPLRHCFSENTDISEMLVVARRHTEDNPDERPPTRFVCLHRNSRKATKALAVAAALRSGTLDEGIGIVSEWPASKMSLGEWRPLGLLSARLVEISRQITDGELFSVHRLGDIAQIGPEGRRIRDVFTKHSSSDKDGRTSLWHNDTDLIRTLMTEPDTYIRTKSDKKNEKLGRNQRLANRYWSQRSSLLFCDKARLNTARVLAARTPTKTVGSHWVPVRHGEGGEKWEKAASMWLNSTLGIVTAVSVAAPNILARPSFSLDAIRKIPVPAFDKTQVDSLAQAFDASADKELLPLAEIDKDDTRQEIDKAISNALAVPADIIGQIRVELSREPSVTQSSKTQQRISH